MISGVACFFFNDTATTEIYTLSLHDALPIYSKGFTFQQAPVPLVPSALLRLSSCQFHNCSGASDTSGLERGGQDRKSTRLNSSHANISYAVFCLKKKIN